MKVKITERGWAAHHICRDRCLFHRNTLIEYENKKWIVSTVGNLRNDKKWDTVGHERWYETKAWQAKEVNGYLEIDVFNPIDFTSDCGLYAKTVEELFEKYPCPDNVANDMHDAVVKELSEKIEEVKTVDVKISEGLLFPYYKCDNMPYSRDAIAKLHNAIGHRKVNWVRGQNVYTGSLVSEEVFQKYIDLYNAQQNGNKTNIL